MHTQITQDLDSWEPGTNQNTWRTQGIIPISVSLTANKLKTSRSIPRVHRRRVCPSAAAAGWDACARCTLSLDPRSSANSSRPLVQPIAARLAVVHGVAPRVVVVDGSPCFLCGFIVRRESDPRDHGWPMGLPAQGCLRLATPTTPTNHHGNGLETDPAAETWDAGVDWTALCLIPPCIHSLSSPSDDTRRHTMSLALVRPPRCISQPFLHVSSPLRSSMPDGRARSTRTMSTFDGIVTEFPQIRIDHFRANPDFPPPLACLLSHVHSDHLLGLESLKAPFVYCSPATKEILLRLERYPHRMNFAKGILESRIQTYKHLGKLLKTIPLETPTTIELCPGQQIRVTLFDANHCIGAVMFLIEGHGKAILYTGDIRSETWWVNSLVRNPVLLPYTLGKHRLERIYLDTTFATKSNLFREFPSKAESIRELLESVEKYPSDTVFYFHAWTFGYENVWLALSNFLDSQIHLGKYRFRLYRSLATKSDVPPCHEAPALCGFNLGNHRHEGCLTSDLQARLHSCENGTSCHVLDKDAKLVRIIPVVTRTKNGTIVPELGAGGGQGDLDQVHELEVNDQSALEQLVELCKDELSQEDPQLLTKILRLLSEASEKNPRISMGCDPSLLSTDSLNNMPLQSVIKILANVVSKSEDPNDQLTAGSNLSLTVNDVPLPTVIHFPYSRHSSYTELCTLVEAFQPKDIYPCTVDPVLWEPSRSMRDLFGHFCSSDVFAHDKDMLQRYDEQEDRRELKRRRDEDSMQLMTSDLEDDGAQDSNSGPPRKRSRSDERDEAETSAEEPFHSTQHATCDMEIRLDDFDESIPNDVNDHHDNTPETRIYLPVGQNDTNASTEAVKGTQTPQASFTPSNPEPQTPASIRRIPAEASNPIPSSPPLYSSSPFNKAVPAPLFKLAHHATPSPRPSKILSTPMKGVEDAEESSDTHSEPYQPETSSPAKPPPPSSIPSSRGHRSLLPPNLLTRKIANDAALEFKGFTWWDFGGLVSAGNNHSEKEEEL